MRQRPFCLKVWNWIQGVAPFSLPNGNMPARVATNTSTLFAASTTRPLSCSQRSLKAHLWRIARSSGWIRTCP
jgi:hypothetical protein